MMRITKNRLYLFWLKMKSKDITFRTLFAFIVLAAISMFQFNATLTHAAPIDISDTPLDVQLQASAPNLMFGIDDSGSMDWEILTTESEGQFAIGNSDYEYVFDDPGDNLYQSGTYSDIITGDKRKYWKSQYSDYNVMYYDPKVFYKPWHSAMPDADPDNARSHPMYDENYTNLNTIYFALTNPSGDVIKDDRDSSGITMTANWATWNDQDAYDGKDHYTTTVNETFTWTPTLPTSEDYEVWVYNAYYSGNDKNAEYTIVHAGGTSTAYSNQLTKGDQWDLLGTYAFNAGSAGSVTVARRNHADMSSYTNADAVKFVKASAAGINVTYAHYFVYSASEGKPYLVNLNGNITYYEYNDDGDNYIEDGELIIDATPPADIITSRTYTEERQNFANWYSFYRKRWGVAVSAICQSIEMLEGVNVGIRSINGYIQKKVVPVKVGGVDETATLLNLLTSFRHYNHPQGSTPLRKGLEKIGQYYSTSETIHPDEPEFAISPLDSGAGGGCQQNFAIMFTDGAYNGQAPGLANIDGSFPAPYADNNSNSLADVAMKYWMTDLDGDDTNNQVPTNFYDDAVWQHLVTYTVAFGVNGTLNPADYDLYNIITANRVYPTWPSPINSDKMRIDDVWHAAVNGRGQYLNASNPQALIDAFLAVINDVIARIGSGAKVSINSEELNEGTAVFQSSYSTEYWSGDVKAYDIDSHTGEVKRGENEELWSASDQLEAADWDSGRVVATFNGASGIPFRFGSLGASQKTALHADPVVAENMLNYLRGDRSLEGSSFRVRETRLGDFVHSAPLYDDGVLYIGGNDGMIHAFNANKTTGGNEMFAYVPGLVFSNLNQLANANYTHKYFVDLTPFVRTVNSMNLLVGGCGKGAKGYFCLNVTDPFTITSEAVLASRVMWEFPNAATASADVADMGYSFSRPVLVNTSAGWVVIFGNGYNSTNESAVLFVLSPGGTLLAKIDTQKGPSNGLSTPAVVDINNDMLADYVYVGDLLGNLWKFDIQSANPAAWTSAYQDVSSKPAPLFTATGPGGAVQPITAKPDAMYHCARHGYMVLFGTGKYLGNSDVSDTSTQTIYGIWDYGDDIDDSEYLGTLNRGSIPNLSNQPDTVSLLEQIEFAEDTYYGVGWGFTTDSTISWGTVDDTSYGQKPDPYQHAGWYFDLPIPRERLIQDMIIRDRYAIFITNIPDSSSPCLAGGESVLNEFIACSGQRPDEPRFDMNNDDELTTGDDTQRRSDCPDCDQESEDDPNCPGCNKPVPPSRGHIPMSFGPSFLGAGDQEIKIMSTASGGIVTKREPGEQKGMFYWREIR
ncbi:MAG: PQQ-binding-like beta-propeller repeat protein [Proteobacteria bacterium]|nr:PQQ-binding-like beta-propeller repeat protein [Pseudomonadota bacterium]